MTPEHVAFWRKEAGLHDYHVTFFYYATGMENGPDEKDHGIITAQSEQVAKAIAIERHHGGFHEGDDPYGYYWVLSCLTAKQVDP